MHVVERLEKRVSQRIEYVGGADPQVRFTVVGDGTAGHHQHSTGTGKQILSAAEDVVVGLYFERRMRSRSQTLSRIPQVVDETRFYFERI